MPTRVDVPGGEIHVVSTVQGLVAERARVREAWAEVAPAAVALGVSAEAVSAMLRYEPQEGVDPFVDLPDTEYAFSARLSEYGEIELPPPDLMEALRLARDAEVPAFGVDLSEEAYVETFTQEVGAFALLWYGRVQRKLAKRPPRADDARAFSLAWDARLRRIRSIGRVEAAREASIAQGARALAESHGRVLLVVDAPREAGVVRALQSTP